MESSISGDAEMSIVEIQGMRFRKAKVEIKSDDKDVKRKMKELMKENNLEDDVEEEDVQDFKVKIIADEQPINE
jgi:hypothetical protein